MSATDDSPTCQGVTRDTMRLRAMKAEGLIALGDMGRGAKWIINGRNR